MTSVFAVSSELKTTALYDKQETGVKNSNKRVYKQEDDKIKLYSIREYRMQYKLTNVFCII